jgi:hypothetical protein
MFPCEIHTKNIIEEVNNRYSLVSYDYECPREQSNIEHRLDLRFLFSRLMHSYSAPSNYSFMIDEEISPNDPSFWSRPTNADCNTIRIAGIFLCLAALIGVTCNGTLISFVRYKALRSPSNIFFMFIAALGLFASCTILPFTGTSAIYCRWLYGESGCKLSAIIAFLYGCSSSYLLCGASLSRCYIIVQPFKAKHITVGSNICDNRKSNIVLFNDRRSIYSRQVNV